MSPVSPEHKRLRGAGKGRLVARRRAYYLPSMMYSYEDGRTLAISQPAHAWIAGQLLRRLALKL